MSNNLTDAQQRAVASNARRILCIAGPGSGKTTTLVARINRLLETESPQGIVAITYTNAAADVLKARVATPIGFIGTLHAYLLKLIREKAYPAVNWTVLDQDSSDVMLGDLRVRHKATSVTLESLKALRSNGHYNKPVGRPPSLPEVIISDYYATLLGNGVMDFDMILHFGLLYICGPMAAPCEHLLVDEVQDSSDKDAIIYASLAATSKTAFLVGDSDQSIFGFRGASKTAIAMMLLDPEVEVITIETNFRCGYRIGTGADAIIKLCEVRATEKENVCPTENGAGEIVIDEHGSMIEAQAQMRFDIAELLRQGAGAGEIGVIARTNYFADAARDFLKAGGVPMAEAPLMPRDWVLAKATLACCAAPNNNVLAKALLAARGVPRGHIETFRIQAEAKRRPLLEIADIATYTEMLNHEEGGYDWPTSGLSAESQAAIHECVEQGASIQDILLRVASKQHRGDFGAATKGVEVCTAHGAKGKEWRHVFIFGMMDGFFPHEPCDEEIRLMFVALTRARNAVHLIWWHRGPTAWASMLEFSPSPYLETLRPFAKEAVAP